MDAQPIDPRDIVWEVDYPTYRVTFWKRDGSVSDEWRITEAITAHDVFAWADARLQDGWNYQVFVEVASPEGLGTLRLAGPNPSAVDSPPR